MATFKRLVFINAAALILQVGLGLASAGAQTNGGPSVSILWPRPDTVLGEPLYMKIKAEATSPNSITQMQFFAQRIPIGTVTAPPFTLFWFLGSGVTNYSGGPIILTVVATDGLGLSSTSAPASIYLTVQPPFPVLKFTSPSNGAVFAAPATIPLTAELLASLQDTGPEEFFLGTNSLGVVNTNGHAETFTIDTPAVSLTLSNVAEGSYDFSVRYSGSDGVYCSCDSRVIRVVKLAAVAPRSSPEGGFSFDVITSFPNQPTVIEASPDLRHWAAISTNRPANNTFTFTNSSPAGAPLFYRVQVLPN